MRDLLKFVFAFFEHPSVLLVTPFTVFVFESLLFEFESLSLFNEVEFASFNSFHEQPVDRRLFIVLVVVQHLFKLNRFNFAHVSRDRQQVVLPILNLLPDWILGHLHEEVTR